METLAKHQNIVRMLLVGLSLWATTAMQGAQKGARRATLLQRIYAYAAQMDALPDSARQHAVYTKFSLHILKRNAILLTIPTMWNIARGRERHFLGEYIDSVFTGSQSIESHRWLTHSTMRSQQTGLTAAMKYLAPQLYGETIFRRDILSPFHPANARFYRYQISYQHDARARIKFRPRVNNTQLVYGEAVANFNSGRLISAQLQGEYDMIRFTLRLQMGAAGRESLQATTVDLACHFKFMGNSMQGTFHSTRLKDAAKPAALPTDAQAAIAQLRPTPLQDDEQQQYARDSMQRRQASLQPADSLRKTTNWWEQIGWNLIGRHMVKHLTGNFGKNNEGMVRISPILNPLYMGYDYRRGITYKAHVNLTYAHSQNRSFNAQFGAGYAFNQHQLYVDAHFSYHYQPRRNGYFSINAGSGNQIANGEVIEQAPIPVSAALKAGYPKLTWFKDHYAEVAHHYDFSPHWGMRAGMMFHRRTAMEKRIYLEHHLPTHFTSAAPFIEMQWRPSGYQGPIVTLDYERAVKDFLRSNIGYERWESDAQWKLNLSSLQSLQMRLGAGGYTRQDRSAYFLDYANFHENHIPGGWNDDWSGEFELLNSNWYNASDYYVRLNSTYEAPLLLLSWIPVVGQVVEKERIYISALSVRKYTPYFEAGYGFTNRLFSIGIFGGWSPRHFEGVGVKFGFELFNNW